MKRNLKATVVILLLLAILIGCSSNGQPIEPNTTENTVQQNPTTEPATDFITEPSDTETAPTEKENEVPLETEPPETTASTEPTEPEVTDPVEAEPAVTEPPKVDPEPEPTAPTVKPEPTKPTEPSTPKPTEPKPTQPKPTTPPSTEPAKHTHEYTVKVVKPTCTKGGYTVHTCSCGDSYTNSKTDPGEHSYDKETVKPTMWQEGYTVYTCTTCDDSYKDDFISISDDAKQAFIEDVRVAIAKYLNQYRENQGSPSAPILPGLSKVANYRAKQIRTNFAHSTADLREAAAYYQYGEYVAPEDWDPSEYYYYFPAREALARGNWVGTADEIGQKIAKGIRNSSGHWAYVGSADYSYMAVGVRYGASATGGYHWTVCVFVTNTNEYG